MSPSPASGSAQTVRSLLGILSLPISVPSPLALSLSLKINKLKKKKVKGGKHHCTFPLCDTPSPLSGGHTSLDVTYDLLTFGLSDGTCARPHIK